MGQKMTWDEMRKSFPDEWVAVVNSISRDETGGVDGEVVFHSNDKDDFYKTVGNIISNYDGMTVKYTGELIKNAETPLLWQITHTA